MKNLQELYDWIEKLKNIKQGDKTRIGDPIYAQHATALLVEAFFGKDRMPTNVDPEDLKNALEAACKAMGINQDKFISLKLQEAEIVAKNNIFSKLYEELERRANENGAFVESIEKIFKNDNIFNSDSAVGDIEYVLEKAEDAAKKFYMQTAVDDEFVVDRFVSEKISNGHLRIRLACALMMSEEPTAEKTFFEKIVDIRNGANKAKSKLVS